MVQLNKTVQNVVKSWDNSWKDTFINNIDVRRIEEIQTDLDNLESPHLTHIESIVSSISSVIVDSIPNWDAKSTIQLISKNLNNKSNRVNLIIFFKVNSNPQKTNIT